MKKNSDISIYAPITQIEKPLPEKNIQREVSHIGDFKKSHEIVFSRQKLTAREQDIFAMMLCHMKAEDWGTEENPAVPSYTIPAPTICKMLGLTSGSLANTLKGPCRKLAERTIGMYDEEKHAFSFRSLFKEVYYKSGELVLRPNDRLKAEYIGGAKGFSLINRESFYSLNREPSKRLFDLLSRFKDKTKGKLNKMRIDDLQGMFGVLDEEGKFRSGCKSFTNTSLFITRYIDDSIAEINKNPLISSSLIFHLGDDIYGSSRLGYNLFKTGKKYTHIEFLYSWVTDAQQPGNQINYEAAVAEIKEIEVFREHLKARGKKLPDEKLQQLYDNYKIAIVAASDDLKVTLTNRANKIHDSLVTRKEASAEKEINQKTNLQKQLAALGAFSDDDDF